MTDEQQTTANSGPGTEAFDLNQFLPYRLSNLADQISAELAHLYAASYGLNVAQWRILAWLRHSEVLTAREIRANTHMDKAQVSRAVQALVDRHLISRSPANADQRRHDLRLTPDGQALLVQLIPEAQAWEANLLATLTVDEHQTLMQTMTTLERRLTQLKKSPG
ncbi:MAG: MarR family winged helix-turn-helix transcriptional regulator [Natronospirillum sp.]